MRLEQLPPSVLAKLLYLESDVQKLAERAAFIDIELGRARQVLAGAVASADDPTVVSEKMKAANETAVRLSAERPITERKLAGARSTAERCKRWINELASDTRLERVKVDTTDHNLDAVRSSMKAAAAELKRLRNAPVPSSDIRDRIEAHVRSMAAPAPRVHGAAGGALRIDFEAHTLALLCAILPDAMVDLAMRDVARQQREPMPVELRPARIAELEAELDHLGHVEEALLVDGSDRAPGVRPQHALQVRVADALSVAA